MSRITQPDLRPYKKGIYRLHEEYSYTTRFRGNLTLTIIVNKGFQCDGVSVPRWLWSLSGIRPDGLMRAAALIHDALYSVEGKLNKFNRWVEHVIVNSHEIFSDARLQVTREEADKIFLEIMKETGVSRKVPARSGLRFRGSRERRRRRAGDPRS